MHELSVKENQTIVQSHRGLRVSVRHAEWHKLNVVREVGGEKSDFIYFFLEKNIPLMK